MKKCTENTDLGRSEFVRRQRSPEQIQVETLQIKPVKKRRLPLYLLLLANFIAFNAVYGICATPKEIPIQQAVINTNLIYILCTKSIGIFNYKVLKNVGNVTGILYSEGDSSAFVDGHLVKEGDSLNGLKIVKINKTSVVLEKDGRMWTQRVSEPSLFER